MKDFKRFIVLLFSLSICAVLLIGRWFLYPMNNNLPLKADQFIQDKEALTRLLQNSSEIHRIWNEGEDSREWNLLKPECLKYFKISSKFEESLLRCHPMVLECNAYFNKKLNYHFVVPQLRDGEKNDNQVMYRYLTKSNTGHLGLQQPGYLFTIEDNISDWICCWPISAKKSFYKNVFMLTAKKSLENQLKKSKIIVLIILIRIFMSIDIS